MHGNEGPRFGYLAGDATVLDFSDHLQLCECDDESAYVRWRGCFVLIRSEICDHQIDTPG